MRIATDARRRTVLRTMGGAIVGSTVFGGTASASDTSDERRQDSFAWARNDLYEMLEAEPHPPNRDSEGNEAAHRPLWIIKSMAGTGVDGSDHSPHPNPSGAPIDHVVPLADFSAQWHVHLVVDMEEPFVDVDGDGEPETPNLVRTDHDAQYLTSANRIQNADNVAILETEVVFTCPIRPHNHRGRN